MTKVLRQLFLATLIAVSICSCSSAADKNQTAARKGAQQAMKTYYMGRFAIDVPAEFKLAVQSHRFRLVEIVEYNNIQDASQKWLEHLAKVEKLQKPRGVSKIVIQDQQFSGMGKWSKGVLYYSDYMADDECNWDIFVSYGNSAALFSLKGLLDKQQSMLVWLQEVARAYRPNFEQRLLGEVRFYTKHGFIELPYKRQEQSYVRFEGPGEMVMRVEMNDIHKPTERQSLVDRTVAAIETGFAGGINIEKLRSRKRTAAGLSGEEEILQGNDGKQKNVSFDWEYLGTVESGEQPMIQISVDTKADNLEEKIRVWDKVMDSFRTMHD